MRQSAPKRGGEKGETYIKGCRFCCCMWVNGWCFVIRYTICVLLETWNQMRNEKTINERSDNAINAQKKDSLFEKENPFSNIDETIRMNDSAEKIRDRPFITFNLRSMAGMMYG